MTLCLRVCLGGESAGDQIQALACSRLSVPALTFIPNPRGDSLCSFLPTSAPDVWHMWTTIQQTFKNKWKNESFISNSYSNSWSSGNYSDILKSLVLVLSLPLSRAYTQREEVTAGVSGKPALCHWGFRGSVPLSILLLLCPRPDSQLALIR